MSYYIDRSNREEWSAQRNTQSHPKLEVLAVREGGEQGPMVKCI